MGLEYGGRFCRHVRITVTEMGVCLETDSELNSWCKGGGIWFWNSPWTQHAVTQPNTWASGGHPAARTTKLDPYDLNPVLAGATELRQMWAGLPSGRHCNLRRTNASDFFQREIQELFHRQASPKTSVPVLNFKTTIWHFNIWQREMNLRSLQTTYKICIRQRLPLLQF